MLVPTNNQRRRGKMRTVSLSLEQSPHGARLERKERKVTLSGKKVAEEDAKKKKKDRWWAAVPATPLRSSFVSSGTETAGSGWRVETGPGARVSCAPAA